LNSNRAIKNSGGFASRIEEFNASLTRYIYGKNRDRWAIAFAVPWQTDAVREFANRFPPNSEVQ
jgi:hypothetical protein